MILGTPPCKPERWSTCFPGNGIATQKLWSNPEVCLKGQSWEPGWLVLGPMGFLCPLSLGASTQLKVELQERNPCLSWRVHECVHVYCMHVLIGISMHACVHMLGDKASFTRTSETSSLDLLLPMVCYHSSCGRYVPPLPPSLGALSSTHRGS